jgi:hypothetical protein
VLAKQHFPRGRGKKAIVAVARQLAVDLWRVRTGGSRQSNQTVRGEQKGTNNNAAYLNQTANALERCGAPVV